MDFKFPGYAGLADTFSDKGGFQLFDLR